TAALFDMFCALKGATRSPWRASRRHSPATSVLLPADDAVPCTISTGASLVIGAALSAAGLRASAAERALTTFGSAPADGMRCARERPVQTRRSRGRRHRAAAARGETQHRHRPRPE